MSLFPQVSMVLKEASITQFGDEKLQTRIFKNLHCSRKHAISALKHTLFKVTITDNLFTDI